MIRAMARGLADRRQMRTRWIVAVGAVLVGAVWLAQGLGLLPGSGFMDGDPFWALAGGALVVVGLVAGVSAWRGRRPT